MRSTSCFGKWQLPAKMEDSKSFNTEFGFADCCCSQKDTYVQNGLFKSGYPVFFFFFFKFSRLCIREFLMRLSRNLKIIVSQVSLVVLSSATKLHEIGSGC